MLQNIELVYGDVETTFHSKPFEVYSDMAMNFLNDISNAILRNKNLKTYEDLFSIAFFFRKSSTEKNKNNFYIQNRMGVGTAFHITPSNVPVQFFYSLGLSLLSGNSNIVRLPSKEYTQAKVLINLLKDTIEKYEALKDKICLVRYGHEKEITDYLSANCDVRIIWGGDESIKQIRMSPIPAKTYDLTFADRFSLCIINANNYNLYENKKELARKFYYDTMFSDQNACNSTRMVVWIGKLQEVNEAKNVFWKKFDSVVRNKYNLQSISTIEKLIKGCELAISKNAKYDIKNSILNYVNIIDIDNLSKDISQYKSNCGFFLQTRFDHETQLFPFIQKDWQTATYFGINNNAFCEHLRINGIKGIDRIVPIGQSGVPSVEWDGVNLIERLSRLISVM